MSGKRTYMQHIAGALMRRMEQKETERSPPPRIEGEHYHIYILCYYAGGSIIAPIQFFYNLQGARGLQKDYPLSVIVRLESGRKGFTII
jgi:hypothetical protein